MTNKRYWVLMKSGRKFLVEEWGAGYTNWGNIDPATNKLQKIKALDSDVIDTHNTQIKKENGFKNICMLAPGTSALGYLDVLDSSGIERIESDLVTYED